MGEVIKMQISTYSTKVLPDGHIELPKNARKKFKPGDMLKVIIIPDDDKLWQKDMEEILTELRAGAKDYTSEEIDQIVDDAVAAVRNEDKN